MFHMDALRAFCMFFDVFVHGSAIDYRPDLFFHVVREASDLFRTATFFLIGGYFTVMVYQRGGGGGDYARSRVQLLVVPLITSLIFVVPITNWLNYCWHNAPVSLTRFLFDFDQIAPPVGKIEWHAHMWFLISMCIYAVLTPVLVNLASTPPVKAVLNWFLARTGRWTVWALALLLRPLGLSMHGTYAGILVLVPVFTLSLHAFIIKPVPILRLLFNGKRMVRRVAAQPAGV